MSRSIAQALACYFHGMPDSFGCSRQKSAVERTYKPDSVPFGICSHTVVIISLGSELPRTSSDLPEDPAGPAGCRIPIKVRLLSSYLALHRATLTLPVMSPSPRWALTPPFHPYLILRDSLGSHRVGHRRSVLCGAGVGSLRLGVTQRSTHEVRTFLPSRRRNERSPGLLPRAPSV